MAVPMSKARTPKTLERTRAAHVGRQFGRAVPRHVALFWRSATKRSEVRCTERQGQSAPKNNSSKGKQTEAVSAALKRKSRKGSRLFKQLVLPRRTLDATEAVSDV